MPRGMLKMAALLHLYRCLGLVAYGGDIALPPKGRVARVYYR